MTEFATLITQLHNLAFTQIGNLYFSIIRDRVNTKMESIESAVIKRSDECVYAGIGTDFVIGRMVKPAFSWTKVSTSLLIVGLFIPPPR